MKIKIYLSEFRRYTERALENYNKKGMKGLQEYCVCSGLNLSAVYTILLESVEDSELRKRRDELVGFYNYEITE